MSHTFREHADVCKSLRGGTCNCAAGLVEYRRRVVCVCGNSWLENTVLRNADKTITVCVCRSRPVREATTRTTASTYGPLVLRWQPK